MNKQKSAFIFIYVLILSFLVLSIGTYLFYKGIMLPPFYRLHKKKTEAEMIALGIIQQCVAQLAYPIKKQEKGQGEEKKGEKPAQPTSFFDDLKMFFPELNHFKNYTLQEKIDGVDANVSICFMSENGKININSVFDFKEKKLRQDFPMDAFSKALEQHNIKGFKSFIEQFFKKRQKPLDDILELHDEEYIKKAFGEAIFYQPSIDEKEREKKVLYLTDLFTVFTDTIKVNPFAFSEALLILLGLNQPAAQSKEERKKQIETIEKQKKETFSWDNDWKSLLQPIYKKPTPFLSPLFEEKPHMSCFSILCLVEFEGYQITFYAVLSRSLRVQDEKIMYDVTIKRLYVV